MIGLFDCEARKVSARAKPVAAICAPGLSAKTSCSASPASPCGKASSAPASPSVKLRARPLPVAVSSVKFDCEALPAMAVTMRRNAAMSMPLTSKSCVFKDAIPDVKPLHILTGIATCSLYVLVLNRVSKESSTIICELVWIRKMLPLRSVKGSIYGRD